MFKNNGIPVDQRKFVELPPNTEFKLPVIGVTTDIGEGVRLPPIGHGKKKKKKKNGRMTSKEDYEQSLNG
jgi:hypothetical protein